MLRCLFWAIKTFSPVKTLFFELLRQKVSIGGHVETNWDLQAYESMHSNTTMATMATHGNNYGTSFIKSTINTHSNQQISMLCLGSQDQSRWRHLNMLWLTLKRCRDWDSWSRYFRARRPFLNCWDFFDCQDVIFWTVDTKSQHWLPKWSTSNYFRTRKDTNPNQTLRIIWLNNL